MTSVADLGALAAASTASPGMIGDFFGGGYQFRDNAFGDPADPSVFVEGASVAVAGGDRIQKFAENNSPLPQDRVFFNYHFFANPVIDVNGRTRDVNRFTFGLEKTAWDGLASIELRVPFAASVSSSQTIDQTADTTAAEFGNLALNVKTLLYRRGPWAVAGGFGIVFPTAADATVFDPADEPVVIFENESYFLQPFVAALYCPTPQVFSQFVAQTSFDVSGSTVTLFDSTIFGLPGSDRIFHQSLLFLDASFGYWAYRTKRCERILTGIAPMIELHYTTTMEDLDLPQIGAADVFEEDLRHDAVNITGGLLFALGDLTWLRAAGVAPLRDETLMYDAEFGVQLIRRF
jgi:hypothetical protein